MNNPYSFIFFLILGIILTAVHFATGSVKTDATEMYEAKGIVQGINRNDNGRKWFYISVETGTGTSVAKTGNYVKVPEGTDIGDEVRVRYYSTKNGNIRCNIISEGFESLAGESENERPYLLYAAILSYAVFVVLLIKQLFF